MQSLVRRAVPIAALLALLASAPACLYLEDINQRPEAELELLPGAVAYRDSTVRLSASKSTDANHGRDELRGVWWARACDRERTACDAQPFDSGVIDSVLHPIDVTIPRWRAAVSGGDVLEAPGSIVVGLRVVDPQGAQSSEERLHVRVDNHLPAVELQHKGYGTGGSYVIGVPVFVFATATDADAVDEEAGFTYRWTITPPRRSGADITECADIGPDGTSCELLADVTGVWTVGVTVTDQLGGEDSTSIAVVVEDDAPPCINGTSPTAVPHATYVVDAFEGPRYFAVTKVGDDLDAYPPISNPTYAEYLGVTAFRWSIARADTGGAFVPLAEQDAAGVLLDPAAFDPGERLRLRLEVDDRIGRELPCAADAATCSLGGDPSCLQRVTWEVEIR